MSRIDDIRKQVESGNRQYRNLVLEVREANEDDYIVEGYATTYNEPYHLYTVTAPDGYRIEVKEEVDRHAFDEADMSDVIMQYDHVGRVFARLSNGTLKLDKDAEKGLLITADLGGTKLSALVGGITVGDFTSANSICKIRKSSTNLTFPLPPTTKSMPSGNCWAHPQATTAPMVSWQEC